jgi:hypothetical protein
MIERLKKKQDCRDAPAPAAAPARSSRTVPTQANSTKGSVGFSPESSKSSYILIPLPAGTQINA